MSELVAARNDCAAATTARAWLAAMNAHDPAALHALLADDFSWACSAASECDGAGAVRTWQGWFAATPDLTLELIRELGDRDWSVQQLRLHGTQRVVPSAAFTPRPTEPLASSRRISIPGCAVLAARGTRIARLWSYWDPAALQFVTERRPAHADF